MPKAPHTSRFWGLVQDHTVLVSNRLLNLTSQQRTVIREKFLLTLWCKPEVNKLGTSLHQAVVSLRGVTAEGDVVATTVSSRNTLKHAVPAPSTEHSVAVLAGGGSGREGPVSSAGAGTTTPVSVSIPRA